MVSIYKKQVEAFEACLDTQFTYAVNYKNSKACFFVNATEKEFWDEYMVHGDRNNYEKIRADRPCHLYLDIDMNIKENPQIDIDECYNEIKDIILFLMLQMGFSQEKVRFIKLSSHSDTKKSLHIIVKIEDCLFENLFHCGEFMAEVHHRTKYKSLIDMSVYSKNRNFRMLGCTKAGQKRYLVGNQPLSYEFWRDTKIQPLSWSGKTIKMDIREKKVSEMSSNIPDFVFKIMLAWSKDPRVLKTIGKINLDRIVCFPENQVYICTAIEKKCPIANRQHSTNHPMLCLNLIYNRYEFRCHSPKCKGKAITFKMNDYLTGKVCI